LGSEDSTTLAQLFARAEIVAFEGTVQVRFEDESLAA
jgi:hypothetical protein